MEDTRENILESYGRFGAHFNPRAAADMVRVLLQNTRYSAEIFGILGEPLRVLDLGANRLH